MSASENGSTSRWWSKLGRKRAEQDLTPYRRLVQQLHHDLRQDEGRLSVLLTSPTNAAISSRGSILLACCAAEELRRPVLLIDACDRDPLTTEMLGAAGRPGFADLRRGTRTPWRDLVLPTVQRDVMFLPAGRADAPPEGTPLEVASWLREAENSHGIVILSGGSVLNDSAAAAMAADVGCVLLAVVENQTRVTELDDAQESLAMCRARKVGLLMTTSVRRDMGSFRVAPASGTPRKE